MKHTMGRRYSHMPEEMFFWSRIDILGDGDCWEWLAGRWATKEYGQFRNAHSSRWAWVFTYGDISSTENVCHHCDNPPCCNSNHLFLGSQLDNMKDCASKGRTTIGSKNPHAKLTESDILRIRKWSSELSVKKLAKLYGVTTGNIYMVLSHRTWTHV